MYSIGLALKLRPGVYQKYRAAHDALWPEIAESMRANNVSMAIYRHDDELFVFAVAPTEAHWQRSRQAPVLDEWDQRMGEFLVTDAAGKLDFTLLPKAFGFGQFAD